MWPFNKKKEDLTSLRRENKELKAEIQRLKRVILLVSAKKKRKKK
jgi:hypothetical protein